MSRASNNIFLGSARLFSLLKVKHNPSKHCTYTFGWKMAEAMFEILLQSIRESALRDCCSANEVTRSITSSGLACTFTDAIVANNT